MTFGHQENLILEKPLPARSRRLFLLPIQV
jgi:hypothetical protein